MLKKIVEFIVRELVGNPSSVRVVEEREAQKIVLTIHVDEEDLGKVIGKGGETIRSIRSMASTLNEQADYQIIVDIAK